MSELSKTKVIGITGSMGSGKSKASSFIRKLYPVLDCDQVNANLLNKGNLGYQELVQLDWIPLDSSQEIDKKEMASKMFQDANKKKTIESILHPLILNEMKEWISKQRSELAFVEVPLLFESHMENLFDSIWCVVVSDQIALERLSKYRNYTESQAKERLATQMPVGEKVKRSNLVLKNDGSLENLENQIQDAIGKEIQGFERND